MDAKFRVQELSDDELLSGLRGLVAKSNRVTAEVLAHLGEVDARKLYLDAACSSLFTYCTEVLHFSEPGAYNRIQAARAARVCPPILDLVATGERHIAGVKELASHLTEENASELVAAARGKSKRAIEAMLAARFPSEGLPSRIRKLPALIQHDLPVAFAAPSEVSVGPSTSPPAILSAPATVRRPVTPIAPERFLVQFTANAELRDKLRQAQDLLRHQVPNGDLAEIVEMAVSLLLNENRKRKCAQTDRPRPAPAKVTAGRPIPAAVRRAVWERDQGQCTFRNDAGRRCGEKGFIELHHVIPFAHGGPATVDNIALMCRAHNQGEAEREGLAYRPSPERWPAQLALT